MCTITASTGHYISHNRVGDGHSFNSSYRMQAPTEWFKAQTSCRGVSNAVIYLQGRDHMLCPILSELTAVYL